ncbi:MAG: patatin-like phospholipase family protein [Thermosulfidibacteraceae bacterium]|jgi:NTE family protein
MKIGLALGGGGARGIAHIGVLKVLEEEGIDISVICGTSIGSIIAVKYAYNPNWKALWDDIREVLKDEYLVKLSLLFKEKATRNPLKQILEFIRIGKTFARMFTSRGIVNLDDYKTGMGVILKDVKDKNIEDLNLKTAVTSVDIESGKEVIITRGKVLDAVCASSAIPGIFPPIEVKGRLLIDGGWIDVIPSTVCYLLGADFVIGVNVGKDIERGEKIRNSMDVILRADEIARFFLCEMRMDEMDFVIEPDIGCYYWNDFDKIEEIFEKGIIATKKVISRIKRKIWMKRMLLINRKKEQALKTLKKIDPVVI